MDPYEILGISRNATDQEVKKAYRALSKKYHPDANVNAPQTENYEEKFKQIQQAYQAIMNERHKNKYDYGFGRSGSGRSAGQAGTQHDTHMRAAVNFIRNRRFSEALRVLEDIEDRNGEWYYIAAIAHAGRGDNATSLQYARRAADMEPDNLEYQNLVDKLESPMFSYRSMQQPYMGSGWDDTGCLRCCAANLLFNLLLNMCINCCCGCN